MKALPQAARWYLYGIWATASLAITSALAWATPVTNPFPLLLVGLVTFVFADVFAVNFKIDDQDDQDGMLMTVVDTINIFLVATAGAYGVLVTFVGSLISDAVNRRPWYKGLFNAAQRSLTFLTMVAIYNVVCGPLARPFEGWRGLLALIIMSAVYFVMNTVLVALIVALVNGQPLLTIYTESLLQVHWIQFITLPLGAVLAVMWSVEPWMLFPALIPLIMAYRSIKAMSSLQVQSQRSAELAADAQRLASKLERLQDTTTAMLSSDELQPLLEVVSYRLAAMMGASAAWAMLIDQQPSVVAARDLPNPFPLDLASCAAELHHHILRQIDTTAWPQPPPWPFVLLIPMLTGGHLIGGFGLAFTQPPTLADDDQRVLLAFAAQTALAVERTQLFDQLQTKQEELIRTSKLAALGTFAAGIAHEFNNLLTAIYGFAQLGLSTENVAEKNDALDVALRTSKRGQSITAGLLTFARRRDSRRELCQIREVLDETLMLVERQLAKANVTIRREYEPTPATFCEPGQIAQVVLNLITNARDAMAESQGGALVLGLREHEGQIELRVSDTGVGIADNLLEQIFQPFVTTKSTLDSGATSGTGLGLAISQNIIESHHGTISVSSTLGQGTTISVRLPIITVEDTPDPPATEGQRVVNA
ncbi:MAG: GAF domain-containing protein [Chloroflexales bacterium]|nr:GAF domain-containing protein [Chloroflexales bacterium]